jgi:hypothetical protein
MNGYGVIPKILNKILEAKTPEKFTQDFLANKLGFPGGSRQPFIGLFKKLGFIDSAGNPSALYNRFRNEATSKSAMAEGMKKAFNDLYSISEYAHELPKDKLKAYVIQLTGAEKNSSRVSGIVGTFEALKDFADFDGDDEEKKPSQEQDNLTKPMPAIYQHPPQNTQAPAQNTQAPTQNGDLKMHIGYNIHLNLPESKDPEVFAAIFKALKQNLLS